MKLTTVLLIVTMMQVSAATFAQNITLKKQNVSLDQLFKEIRKQTGYAVIWSGIKIKETKNINANFDNTPLEQVLSTTLKAQKLKYEIDKMNIIVTRERESIIENIKARFQKIDVMGKVVNEMGIGIPGATVCVKGKNISTTTSEDGSFVLQNVDENNIIVITFVGYQTTEIDAKEELGDVKLIISDSKLDEVQVIAYGQVQKRFSTSNQTSITGEEISRQPVTNPLLALQGRSPGLFIRQNSGVNGSNVAVNIQGVNSLQNSSEPFYVIDGVPYVQQFANTLMGMAVVNGGSNFNFINPADIESVTVLKDADATAIYGSRAANGAILITTKRGKAGKTKVDVNIQSGKAKVAKFVDLMNTQQYLEIRKEAYSNAGQAIPTQSTTPSFSNYDLTVWDQKQSTDWQKELVGGTGSYTDVHTSISGGSENTRFLTGYTYHRETTVYPGKLANSKGSFNFSLDHNSTDKRFNYQLSGSFLQDRNKLNSLDLMLYATSIAPNTPNLLNADGSLNWGYIPGTTRSTFLNPLAFTLEQFTGNTSNILANNTISYELLSGLTLKASFGYNKLSSDETKLTPLEFYNPALPTRTRTGSYLNKSINSWIAEPQISYVKNTNVGNLDILLGATLQQTKTNVLQQTGSGYVSDAQLGNLLAAPTKTIDVFLRPQYNYTAGFARINYRLYDKYIINFNLRRDGSSRFGDENKFNNFYSVGGAWLFSNEELVGNYFPWLSFGKIRANYGSTGNDQINDYRYLSLLSTYSQATNPYQQSASLIQTSIANPFLQWEETRKLNLGLDLGFNMDMIMLNVNYFRNRSSNQLIPYSLPIMSGFSSVDANFPATVQNTGIETIISLKTFKNKALNWNTSFNLTIPRNKLIEFQDLANSSYSDIYVIGKSINLINIYKYSGVNSETGLWEFINNKGEITSSPNSLTDKISKIDLNPKYYGGWSNTLSYKNFQIDILLQFTKQLGPNFHYGYFAGSFNVNQPEYVINRWRNKGDDTDIQKISRGADVLPSRNAMGISDAIYSDASYIRLKNMSFSYSIPPSIITTAKMSDARLYIQGQNLLTFSNYKGSDPEILNQSVLPPLRTIVLGIQVTF